MLESVSVKNLALIDELRIEFGPGLNVITGPTGSGKTLLMEALRLALGERADYDLLADGDDPAEITAFFSGEQLGSSLCAEGPPPEELKCRRLLKHNHQSPAHLNGERVRLEKLRGLRRELIDFHGQHENQNVFAPEYPREVLDQFGTYEELLQTYRETYEEYREIEERISELEAKQSDAGQQKQFLAYQLEELEDFAPGENEWSEIEEKRRRMESSEEIDRYLRESLNLLDGQGAPGEQLNRVAQLLEELSEYTEGFTDWQEEVRSMARQLEELRQQLREAREQTAHSETEYESLLDRRGEWMQLARKHNVAPEALYSHYEDLKKQLHELEQLEANLDRLRGEQQEVRRKLDEIAAQLSEKRRAAAAELESNVSRRLANLDLEKARFKIKLSEREPGPYGQDKIDWYFASHNSQSLDLLQNRVSGGEISRVMLAIKAALAEADTTPVLVFDEIDIGISGEEARSVGQVLSELADYHQVLCITHLPLVSIYADRHLLVQREDLEDRVEVTAGQLESEARLDELCRLLAGEEASNVSRRQAEQLLQEVNNGAESR